MFTHFEKYKSRCEGLSKYVYTHYGIFILTAICHKHFLSSAKHMNMKKVSVKHIFTKALQIAVQMIAIFFTFHKWQSSKLVAFWMFWLLVQRAFLPIPALWREDVAIWGRIPEAKYSWELKLWSSERKTKHNSTILYDYVRYASDIFVHCS